MSSILDALERAEEQRAGDPKPPAAGQEPQSGLRRLRGLVWPLLGWGGMIVVFLAAGYWVWSRVLPERDAAAPGAAASGTGRTEVLGPGPRHRENQSGTSPAQPSEIPEQLRRVASPSTKPLLEEAVVARPGIRPRPTRASAEAVSDTPVAVGPDARTGDLLPTPMDAGSLSQGVHGEGPEKPVIVYEGGEVPESREPAPQEVEALPGVWELPRGLREKLLRLKSSVHVYSEEPAQRFVIINMHRYREGDRLVPEGFRLERIERDGVVIDYGGGQVRMP